MQYQKTLARSISYTGIGLHSGKDVTITLHPAEENTGIVFERVDLATCPRVRAIAENVTNTMRATTLEDGEAKVFTVEHLMAAFHVMGVTNCRVEISSPEPPVADGSAKKFIELIEEAGICTQEAKQKIHMIEKAITVRDADKFITVIPYDGFRVSFTSVNPHPYIGVQYGDYEITPEVFKTEIASARTIAFADEIEALQKMGLGLGGSMENVVIYDKEHALNPLHYADELVRHKILDVVGDLGLTGGIRGHVIAVKSSHALNTQLAKLIVQEKE